MQTVPRMKLLTTNVKSSSIHFLMDRSTESLFQPSILGLEEHGIVEQLVPIISTVSSENHRQLLENTVLCPPCRFQKEANLYSSAIRPTMVKPPDYMPENLGRRSDTKADYEETGPSVVHRKCF
ncbi:Actin-related protein 7 [Cardamine amara subsp. amara]|uniref:Actin-related protein 7 n=1 Tax=Cardamine amara subsp. amara TaxID=228776 RepID=A0ABD1ANB0_CARAN